MELKIFPAKAMTSAGLEDDYIVVVNMKNGKYWLLWTEDEDDLTFRRHSIYLFNAEMFFPNAFRTGLIVYKVKPFMKIGEYYAVAANECKWIYLDKPTENIDEAFEQAITKYQTDHSPMRKPDCARIWKEKGLYKIVIPMYTAKMSEVEKWIKEYTETMIFEVLARLM
jgi:hypothetical protein